MFALAAFYVIGYALRYQNKLLILGFSTLIACFVGFDKAIGDYLYLSRIIVFFPFFWLGTMVSSDQILVHRNTSYWKKFSLALAILVGLGFICHHMIQEVYFFRGFFTGRNPFPPTLWSMGPMLRLLCYGITIALSWSIIVIIPKFKIPLISTFGARSLSVYFWHYTVVALLVHHVSMSQLAKTPLGLIVMIMLSLFIVLLFSVKLFDLPFIRLRELICSKPYFKEADSSKDVC